MACERMLDKTRQPGVDEGLAIIGQPVEHCWPALYRGLGIRLLFGGLALLFAR